VPEGAGRHWTRASHDAYASRMAHAMNARVLLALALVCGSYGCGGKTSGLQSGVAGKGGAIAVTGGSASLGGSAGSARGGGAGAGGAGTGGAATGGTGIGGQASGGASGMDAAAPGGSGSGGLATGGAAGAVATGGSGVAGTGTGGAGTGGAATGGAGAVAAGGSGSGGARTGGAGTGGAQTGGSGSGGARTGGTGAGGTGGTPPGAFLDLAPTSMDFGQIALGTTAVATFTLTNQGASPSGVPSFAAEGATYPLGTPNPVTVSGCGAALAPNASCTFTISVTPSKLGLLQAFVRITADPGAQSRLTIYVVGWAIGFEVTSPSSLDLGDLAPGVSVKHSITVTALIALSDLTVRTSGEDLSVDASATTCTATLAQGASCVVTVEFLASTVGWKRDYVGINAGGDSGQIVSIQLTANVSKSSDLAVEPRTPPTYACVIEQTSPPVVFTVTNLGDTPSGTITSAIVGESARDFAISDTDCTSLTPQATCTVSVVCSPPMSATTATRHAILSVTDGNTHLSVPLDGEVSFAF